jgi:hypothetical protein
MTGAEAGQQLQDDVEGLGQGETGALAATALSG